MLAFALDFDRVGQVAEPRHVAQAASIALDRYPFRVATAIAQEASLAQSQHRIERLLVHIARRRALESHIAAVAACRSSTKARASMTALFERIETACRAGSVHDVLHLDSELETMMAEAAGLTAAGQELQLLKRDTRECWDHLCSDRHTAEAVSFRGPLIAAICFRDPHGAQRAIADFFDYIVDLVKAHDLPQ
jgi:DNA-binding FadR family transcriptional regulator